MLAGRFPEACSSRRGVADPSRRDARRFAPRDYRGGSTWREGGDTAMARTGLPSLFASERSNDESPALVQAANLSPRRASFPHHHGHLPGLGAVAANAGENGTAEPTSPIDRRASVGSESASFFLHSECSCTMDDRSSDDEGAWEAERNEEEEGDDLWNSEMNPELPSLSRAMTNGLQLTVSETEALKAIKAGKALSQEAEDTEPPPLLDASQVAAFARILVKKIGSLTKAFRWFCAVNTGRITRVQWETGMIILHIDVVEVTGGVSAGQIFGLMDKSQKGIINRRDWISFFEILIGTDAEELLPKERAPREPDSPTRRQRKVASDIKDREKARRGPRRLRVKADAALDGKVSPTSPKSSAAATDLIDGTNGVLFSSFSQHSGKTNVVLEDPSTVDERLDEKSSSRRDRDKMSCDENGNKNDHNVDGGDDEDEGLCNGSLAPLRVNPEEYGAEDEESFRTRVWKQLSRLGPGEAIEYPVEIGQEKMAIVEEVASELRLWTHALHDCPLIGSAERAEDIRNDFVACVMVMNLLEFAEQSRAKLSTIQPGESLEFSASLTENQRRVVHIEAANLDMWTCSEGRGSDRRLIAFNMIDFANEVRQTLEVLGPGDSHAFPAEFTSAQRKLVHLIATELELWPTVVRQNGVYTEVFNLKNFVAEIRHKLVNLKDGEEHIFGNDHSALERRAIHCIAAELNLVSQSQGDGKLRHCGVANLQSFRAEVLSQLEVLAPGETKVFGEGLTELQRLVVRSVAEELLLRPMIRQKRGVGQWIEVARPLSVADRTAASSAEGEGVEGGSAGGAGAGAEGVDGCEEAGAASGASLAGEGAAGVRGGAQSYGTSGGGAQGGSSIAGDIGIASVDNGEQHLDAKQGQGGRDQKYPKKQRKKDRKRRRSNQDRKRRRSGQNGYEGGEEGADDEGPDSGGDDSSDATSEASEVCVLEACFEDYATGVFRGQKVFLRFPDLAVLIEDLKDVMPRKYRLFHRFIGELEVMFDDTLQLQSDMSGIRKGLTLQFFHVFIQKSSKKTGMLIVNLLSALVERD